MEHKEYQVHRKELLANLEQIKNLQDKLKISQPSFFTDISQDAVGRLELIERDIRRLRKGDLAIAFLGGFSAGKSSLLNAFLGRYILPESTEITTAVPTYVRSTTAKEYVQAHYLTPQEFYRLEDLYRSEISKTFRNPRLKELPIKDLLSAIKTPYEEGIGQSLVESFIAFQEKRKKIPQSKIGKAVQMSVEQMKSVVQNEQEALILDRVEVFIRTDKIPSDVVLIDLPGVSVPNPRHRQVTFEVIREAHAVIFVLMALRLFDRDENLIVDKIREGEGMFASKTFWALNRWDSLNEGQKESALADFKEKMRTYKLRQYKFFTTNALYGLLAKLCLTDNIPDDPILQQHLKGYLSKLFSDDQNAHMDALRESKIPDLEEEVLSFINHHMRRITLASCADNTLKNNIIPLTHHLKGKIHASESFAVDRNQEKRIIIRQKTDEHVGEMNKKLHKITKQITKKLGRLRQNFIADQENVMEKAISHEIKEGSCTDAMAVYDEIMGQERRTCPFYFEIEMKVVESLNRNLKQTFCRVIEEQVEKEIEILTDQFKEIEREIAEDVGHDPNIMGAYGNELRKFTRELKGMAQNGVGRNAPMLDALLVYKPGWFAGNPILQGLERAAKMTCIRIENSYKVDEKDMMKRTKKIRAILKKHYIKKAKEFRDSVASDAWHLTRDYVIGLERKIAEILNTRYRTVMETIVSQRVAKELEEEINANKICTRFYRETCEKLEEISRKVQLLRDLPN